jgi:hypothetical protein
MIRGITAKESTRHVAEQSHHLIAAIQECAAKEDAPAEKHKLHHILDKLWRESQSLGRPRWRQEYSGEVNTL